MRYRRSTGTTDTLHHGHPALQAPGTGTTAAPGTPTSISDTTSQESGGNPAVAPALAALEGNPGPTNSCPIARSTGHESRDQPTRAR
ncbi:hypothetical protein Axi01nite_53020 [Actinoplanes xinjiangensis]|nr:hypothetical protein Axi01nite_53020 [Actinoplanes xinjiangensis]